MIANPDSTDNTGSHQLPPLEIGTDTKIEIINGVVSPNSTPKNVTPEFAPLGILCNLDILSEHL